MILFWFVFQNPSEIISELILSKCCFLFLLCFSIHSVICETCTPEQFLNLCHGPTGCIQQPSPCSPRYTAEPQSRCSVIQCHSYIPARIYDMSSLQYHHVMNFLARNLRKYLIQTTASVFSCCKIISRCSASAHLSTD